MTDILEEAQLGVEAENFKSSRLGQYLQERAESEIIEATEALCLVDPNDSKKIIELQNKVYRANSFIIWVFSAIEDGNFAIDEIREAQDD